MDKIFGSKQKGPSAAEVAMQRDRYQEASRAEADADQRAALASRATSLRAALSDRERQRKATLGG